MAFDYDDFYAEGAIGLIKAFRNFDESKNIKFSTYAMTCIRGNILRFIRDNYHAVHYPRALIEKALFTDGEEQIKRNVIYLSSKINEDVTFENLFHSHDDLSIIDANERLGVMDKLTRNIIKLRMAGYNKKEIANLLDIGYTTVNERIKKEGQYVS